MKDMMSRMMGKEDDMEPDDQHHEAKLEVLNELRDMAMKLMGDKVKGRLTPDDDMKQVTVAAPDAEGLKKGLDMAQDVVPDSSEESMESEEPGDSELSDDMSPEEIDEMIKELEDKKAKLSGSSLKLPRI